jgi:SGNH hydrolase-like domain, acetyltransferase AlgX
MADGIEGRLEAVVDGRAVGWVWDPTRPQEALEVEVLVDEEPVAGGRADVERAALAEAGIGTGRYGFDVSLPERLVEEPAHAIRVTAGPRREAVAPFHGFETVVRETAGAWRGTKFVPAGRRSFVPAPEDPPDAGAAALLGRHSWLFPWDAARLGEEQIQGAPMLGGSTAESHAEAIAQRRRRLRELRIPYLFAVAPLKERVYRRFLPPGASLHEERPAAQVDRALRAAVPFEVLDLLPALRAARNDGLAFPRTDSRWSDRGAFFAYRELMREAAKRIVDLPDPLSPDQAPLLPRQGFRGDLAGKPKLRLEAGALVPVAEEGEREEEIDVADVSQLRALRMPAPQHLEVTPERAPRLYEVAGEPALPRALLVGDDSCLKLIPWLAEHFRRFVFLWADELPLEAIELEAPDLVIHVLSEQRLLREP